jgi:hypothetical protein
VKSIPNNETKTMTNTNHHTEESIHDAADLRAIYAAAAKNETTEITTTVRSDLGGTRTLRVGQGAAFKSDMECYGTITRIERGEFGSVWVTVEGDFADTNYGQRSARLRPTDLFDLED